MNGRFIKKARPLKPGTCLHNVMKAGTPLIISRSEVLHANALTYLPAESLQLLKRIYQRNQAGYLLPLFLRD